MTIALLDDAALEAFATDGYTIVDDVFTPDECDEIVAHVEAAAFELALGDRDEGRLSYRPMMHLASPALTAVATDPRWAPIVLPIVDTGDARLYWEQAVVKPPGARTELPWHQDNGYTPLVPEQYLTCWLALDDATLDNGCLWVIPRSHEHGTARHRNGPGPFRTGHEGPASDGIPVPVRRGSVLAFSSLLMHRSGPNETDRLRCARDGEWLPEPVRERDFDLAAVLANYDQR